MLSLLSEFQAFYKLLLYQCYAQPAAVHLYDLLYVVYNKLGCVITRATVSSFYIFKLFSMISYFKIDLSTVHACYLEVIAIVTVLNADF